MQEMRVQSLGWEELPEKEMPTHFSIVWKIPWTERPGSPWGPKRVRHNLVTKQQQQQTLHVSNKRKLKMPQKK